MGRSKSRMNNNTLMKQIDEAIKEVWLNDISSDYDDLYLLKEDSLKCSLYYHLRFKLGEVLADNNLRIYPEYYIPELKYKADLAIVRIDPYEVKPKLKDMVTEVISVIETKYDFSAADSTIATIESDVEKIKDYLDFGMGGRCYFACIYENEVDDLRWFDETQISTWAKGRVTELDAWLIDDFMTFEINEY